MLSPMVKWHCIMDHSLCCGGMSLFQDLLASRPYLVREPIYNGIRRVLLFGASRQSSHLDAIMQLWPGTHHTWTANLMVEVIFLHIWLEVFLRQYFIARKSFSPESRSIGIEHLKYHY